MAYDLKQKQQIMKSLLSWRAFLKISGKHFEGWRMVKSETRQDAETPRHKTPRHETPRWLFENPRPRPNMHSRLFAKAVEISTSHEKFTRPKSLEVPFATPISGPRNIFKVGFTTIGTSSLKKLFQCSSQLLSCFPERVLNILSTEFLVEHGLLGPETFSRVSRNAPLDLVFPTRAPVKAPLKNLCKFGLHRGSLIVSSWW